MTVEAAGASEPEGAQRLSGDDELIEGEVEGDLWAWEEEVGTCGPVSALLGRADASVPVRPIIFNRAIEVIEPPDFAAAALPFAPLDPAECAALATPQLEQHSTSTRRMASTPI